MKRFLACLALAGCSSAAVGAGHHPAQRAVAAAQLDGALADPLLGVVVGAAAAPALASPLRREGAVTLALPGQAAAVTLEVSLRSPAEPRVLDDLPLAVALARQAAAQLVGVDPARWRWKASFVSAPPAPPLWASAQLAIGFAIALTGAPLRTSHAVAIGVIDPTGALLHVPTPSWARGASRGQLFVIASDQAKGALADVIASAGGASRPLAGMAETFTLFTGQALPAAAPADEAMHALSTAERASLESALAAARQAMVPSWEAVLLLDGAPRVPAQIRILAAEAARATRLAEQMAQQGELPAALLLQGRAAAHAAAAIDARRLVERVQLGHAAEGKDLADELLAIDAHAKERAQAIAARGEAAPSWDALGLALEALAQRPRLAAWAQAAAEEITEVGGRELADLGSPETADRLAVAIAPLALGAEAMRQAIAIAELLAQSQSAPPPAASSVLALPASGADLTRWRAEVLVDAGVEHASFLELLELGGCGAAPAASDASATRLCRWAAERAAEGTGWRALGALRAATGESSDARTITQRLEALERAASTSLRGAHVAWGAAPLAARFWLAAGRALTAAGERALAREAFWHAHASAELALRLARARASARADERAAPAR